MHKWFISDLCSLHSDLGSHPFFRSCCIYQCKFCEEMERWVCGYCIWVLLIPVARYLLR